MASFKKSLLIQLTATLSLTLITQLAAAAQQEINHPTIPNNVSDTPQGDTPEPDARSA
jgi:hypothetical protein